jgi:hypothetical protein
MHTHTNTHKHTQTQKHTNTQTHTNTHKHTIVFIRTLEPKSLNKSAPSLTDTLGVPLRNDNSILAAVGVHVNDPMACLAGSGDCVAVFGSHVPGMDNLSFHKHDQVTWLDPHAIAVSRPTWVLDALLTDRSMPCSLYTSFALIFMVGSYQVTPQEKKSYKRLYFYTPVIVTPQFLNVGSLAGLPTQYMSSPCSVFRLGTWHHMWAI